MTSPSVFVSASPDIVFEEFDGDLVALDLATGRYFGFNAPAQLLWKALIAGSSPADIARAQISGGAIGADAICKFVGQLLSFELLKENPEAQSSPMDPAMAQSLAKEGEKPSIEFYDDLADLIVADPIHDTEESAGWPHVRPAGQ